MTSYIGFRATEDLAVESTNVNSESGNVAVEKLITKVALVPILRAGLGMVDPMLDILPDADVHHIGMYRSKESTLPILYYNKVSCIFKLVLLVF